ncbi:MAG: hypothetical protein ACXWV6_15395 [Chitinophagaceae bacterium]
MENEVKEPTPKYKHVSQKQYLDMERASETKHEYYKGEVLLCQEHLYRTISFRIMYMGV